jgi:hypothetical protein
LLFILKNFFKKKFTKKPFKNIMMNIENNNDIENGNGDNINSDNDIENCSDYILENDNNNILKIDKIIVYPNEKIYQVAPIIETKIEERDNYQPNCCLVNCQYYIRMLLDIATYIYICLENFIQWFSAILVILDIFDITMRKIKIEGRSKYNYFTIESSEDERLRRIVYWFYYNNPIPDEDQWRATLKKFNLVNVPKYTMRLYINDEKSNYFIELNNLNLQSYVDNIVVKGERSISLYEDIINTCIDDTNIFISTGKKLLKTIEGKIPVGGLMPDRFIKDLELAKIEKKIV